MTSIKLFKWLKRFGFLAMLIIMLEVISWVGITLLGENWFKTIKQTYISKEPTKMVVKKQDNFIEKCSTFDGEIFCIKKKQ